MTQKTITRFFRGNKITERIYTVTYTCRENGVRVTKTKDVAELTDYKEAIELAREAWGEEKPWIVKIEPTMVETLSERLHREDRERCRN